MPFFSVIHSSKRAGWGASRVEALAAGELSAGPGLRRLGAQQPQQLFFSRAFMSASSALIESTYLPAWLAIDLHSGVWALADWQSPQIAARMTKNLISTLLTNGTRPRIPAFPVND